MRKGDENYKVEEYTLKRANAWMRDGEKHSKALEAKCTEMCAHIQ